jgi:hypothetical protein
MDRDIDQIIKQVRQRLPDIEVVQLKKSLPADDDGIWWFTLPDVEKDIQIESSFGNCPFIVETDELCCESARKAETVDEAVSMIVDYLHSLKDFSKESRRI